jgi:hypothetical protein
MKVKKYKNGIVVKGNNKKATITKNKENIHVEITRMIAKDEVIDAPTCRCFTVKDKVVVTQLMLSKEGAELLQIGLRNYLHHYGNITNVD